MKHIGLTIYFTIGIVGLCMSQSISTNEMKYLNENLILISQDDNYLENDWNSTAQKLNNKKLVLLGEFNHGSKEVFTLRNDLIKTLYKKYNFNVILFESGIGELATINLNKEFLNPQQLTQGFFGGWRTKEFQELMTFVKKNDINVAGFDIQRTGNNFSALFTTKEVNIKDSLSIIDLETRFSEAKGIISNRKSDYNTIKKSIRRLIVDYEALKTRFDYNTNKTKSQKFIRRTIYNRIHFLNYMLEWQKTKNYNQRWEARDSAMADNVSWLITNFYPNSKVIIIAHNYHIATFNEKEEVMGEFLKSTYGDNMYSLGVFASKGVFSNNSGKPEKMVKPDKNHLDIKHVINSLSGEVNFLNVPKNQNSRNGWLFKNIIINDTFINLSGDNTMILSKSFDGLLLIDKVSVPDFN